MWLLNVETRKLERFEGRNIPGYAILSHRWTGDEVSFQDIFNGSAQLKQAYNKIDGFCKQVAIHFGDVAYIWIDTCCIDKSNNSELSEAINSMYKWYAQAKACYAYLADVCDGSMADFAGSAWFSRGWTLQELLAPDDVHFYDQSWAKLGTKLELSEKITQITGIPADALEHFDSRRSPHSVADRMSWAAQRQTTREEDLAYSLLGIFGVNMPLLYGEGSRAFLRLQEEILKISEDMTILAWQKFLKFPISNDYLRDTSSHDFGLFAASPESFNHVGRKFRNLLDRPSVFESNISECTFSGAGLAINVVLVPYCPDIYIVPLCDVLDKGLGVHNTGKIAAMFVERTRHRDRYSRIIYNSESLIIGRPGDLNIPMGRTQRIILERTPYHAMGRQLREKYGFNVLQIEHDILRLFQVNGQDKVEILKRNPTQKSLFLEPGEVGVAGMIRLSRRKLPPIYFHFGFDFDFNPFCLISRPLYRDQTSQDHKIVFKSSTTHVISVECNLEVLRLVNILQNESRKANFQEHNVELHMGSWRSKEMQFIGRDCRISLDMSAGHEQGYVYHVYLGLAHKHYPWASDPSPKNWNLPVQQEFKWYSTPWDNG